MNDNSITRPPLFDAAWTEQTKQDMRDILDMAPDATSCDLAAMLEKPCNEVWRFRLLLAYIDVAVGVFVIGLLLACRPRFYADRAKETSKTRSKA